MSEIATLRSQLRAARAELIAGLGGLADGDLARPWPWRDGTADVRYALIRAVDHEQEHALQIADTLERLGWRASEAQRILGLAEISRGDLLGCLIGVADDLLDREPRPGEWPLRRVLGHLLVTERRYRQRTAWHVAEARAGRPTTAAPPPGVVDDMAAAAALEGGTLADLRARLAAEREEALATLADCTEADLAAPTNWAGFDVDVRFRLHRFAAHEREHAVQVAKTLAWLGHAPSEAHRLLAQAEQARGRTLALLVGLPDDALTRRPAPADWSVAEVLDHLAGNDRWRIASVGTSWSRGSQRSEEVAPRS